MAISHIMMIQNEPVHFRMRGLEPNPLPPPLSQPGQLLRSIELLNHEHAAGANYAMWQQQVAPYRDANWEAIRT